MKNIIIIACLLVICSMQLNAEKVTKEKARNIAESWKSMKMNIRNNDKLVLKAFVHESDTTLYIFNQNSDGFIIISADDNTVPVLGYSDYGSIDFDNLPDEFLSWLEYFSEMISNNREIKRNKNVVDKWREIDEGIILKSLQVTVSSLFESTSSSSWVGWTPYHNQAPYSPVPFHQGTNGCVPGRMAELMKYHRYPRIGNGAHTYTYDGVTISESFNKIFKYEEMPYRLTYCGNGHPTCNDGSFDIIPGTTQNNIDQIGWLQYLAGVSVEMWWLGTRGHPDTVTTGTFILFLDGEGI